MVNVYSASNMTSPLAMNYGSMHHAKGVALYRFDPAQMQTATRQERASNDFAYAIYGDGPYSLLCPNETTEFVGQRFDALA